MLARGLNQTSLARKSGVERTVISRIITGKARPRLEQIGWIATALRIDANDLLLDANLSPELQDLVIRLRAAMTRIAELERERNEAWVEVERLRSEARRRSRAKRAHNAKGTIQSATSSPSTP